MERVDLTPIVVYAIESAGPFIEAQGHHLEVSPHGPIRLEADPARLSQVLAILLSNAAKYTPPGGRIALSVERQGAEVVLRVRDNGIGIRPEMRERIFEPFVHGDRIAGQVQEGLGIGLTLARSLIELHGGTVEAHSDGPGRGSEFVVRLPAPAEGSASPDDGERPP